MSQRPTSPSRPNMLAGLALSLVVLLMISMTRRYCDSTSPISLARLKMLARTALDILALRVGEVLCTVITFVIVICSFNTKVKSQTQAEVLWARGEGTHNFTSIHYLPNSHSLITISELSGLRWPLGPNSLPNQKADFGGNGFPGATVLAKNGTELLIATTMGELFAWDLANNNVSLITNFGSDIEWLDATGDGRLIATSSVETNELNVYDRAKDKVIIHWTNGGGDVSFSPDGRLLLASSNKKLVLVDVEANKIIRTFDNTINPAPVAFNPVHPGRFVVQGNFLKEMDTSGRVLNNLGYGTTSYKTSIAYSPSGNQLAVEVGGGLIVVNLIDSSKKELSGYDPCFIAEDTLAVTLGTDLKLLSLKSNKVVKVVTSPDSWYLSLFDDGQTLVNRGYISMNVTDGQPDGSVFFDHGFPTHGTEITSYSLHGSVAAGFQYSPQYGMYFWPSRSDSGVLLNTILDSICYARAAFSPDSSIFAIGVHIGCGGPNFPPGHDVVKLFRTSDHQKLFDLETPAVGGLNAIVFSHNGNLVAVSDGDSCYIWNTSSGERVHAFGAIFKEHPALGVEVISFLPGDTSLILRGYDYRSLSGARLRFVEADQTNPYSNRTQIIRLSDSKYYGGFDVDYNRNYWYWSHDSTITFFDLDLGKVTNTVTVKKAGEGCMVVNPVTGEFAIGGQDLMYYKSIDPHRASVKIPYTTSGLNAYCVQSSIKIDISESNGKLFAYRSDGRCCFSIHVDPDVNQYSTPKLPSGVYFIIYQSTIGERKIAKVSLLE